MPVATSLVVHKDVHTLDLDTYISTYRSKKKLLTAYAYSSDPSSLKYV
jgi:hypothetical protein